jgi:hypothetical protein
MLFIPSRGSGLPHPSISKNSKNDLKYLVFCCPLSDISKKDKQERTALQVAFHQGAEKCAEVLVEKHEL